MPWITKGDKRAFEPRLPIPTITPPQPPFPNIEGAALLRRQRIEFWLWWKRHLAEFYEIYLYCPRVACKRNKACCGPDANCHEDFAEVIREIIYPEVRKALRARRPPPE